MLQALISNHFLMTVPGGWVSGVGDGDPQGQVLSWLGGDCTFTQACRPQHLYILQAAFLALSLVWKNVGSLGTFLDGCCWQLLMRPEMSQGARVSPRASSLCLPHTWPPTSPQAPAFCGFWFLPCTVRVGPPSGCHSFSDHQPELDMEVRAGIMGRGTRGLS